LRNREGDALLLAHAFVRRFAREHGRSTLSFTQEAVDALEAHQWPGNVRELENCVKRAVIMADAAQIAVEDLGLSHASADAAPVNLRQVREDAEKKTIIRVLSRVDGNIVSAAGMLGISRPTLYDLLNRYGLKAQMKNGDKT
jgi:two-component system, NtrC family, response regulator